MELQPSNPYLINIPTSLDDETLSKLNPVDLERARYKTNAPIGAETLRKGVLSTLSPEVGRQLFSKKLQFMKESTRNAEILGSNEVALGNESLKMSDRLFRSQMMGKAIGDAIKMAGMAYMGYQLNKAASSTTANAKAAEAANNAKAAEAATGKMSGYYQPFDSVSSVSKEGFFSTPWGGSLLAGISPIAFGLHYVKNIYSD